MNKEFKKIWRLALIYQDKRDDKGHAKIVTDYAIKLCQLEKANLEIVVPAAILHDIGWSQLSGKDRFSMFQNDAVKLRFNHQKEGVILAKKILKIADYPPRYLKPILEIISQHDTRKGFFSKEDGLVRDADKLWRFTYRGIKADKKRRGNLFNDYFEEQIKSIAKKDYFYSLSARKLARQELKKYREKERKNE